MNKEEFDINQELEQMRQDYAALKERFDKQQIINDRLMEKAFKSDVRWLSTDKQSGLIAGALGIPLVIVISIIRKVKRFKQQYHRYFFVFMTGAVILAGTFAPTVYHSWSTPEQGMKMVLLLVLTVVALCIIGFLYYKRLMKACDSILDRLKMKEEE